LTVWRTSVSGRRCILEWRRCHSESSSGYTLMRHGRRGFTLIELLLVVVIIGILASIAIGELMNTKQRALRSAGIADIRNLTTAQEGFMADNDRYGSISDTAAMRFTPSRGNTVLSITLAGTPAGTGGWSSTIAIPGPQTCGIFVGTAARPTGMPASVGEGSAACW
jgi:prepilin-type N-terminal cleavage/methylation domain-containing protein